HLLRVEDLAQALQLDQPMTLRHPLPPRRCTPSPDMLPRRDPRPFGCRKGESAAPPCGGTALERRRARYQAPMTPTGCPSPATTSNHSHIPRAECPGMVQTSEY